MSLDVMLTNNYKDIADVAKRITQRRFRGTEQDLINSTYLRVYDAGVKVPSNGTEFLKFFSKCMTNTMLNERSTFSKMHRPKEEQRELIEISSNEEESFTINIEKCKSKLLEHEAILFELHIEKGISCRTIAKMYTGDGHRITKQSITDMVNGVKSKIKKIHFNESY